MCVKVESGYQPLVAFMCSYPAMHLTESGWIKDDETDCVDDAEDVLNYCKKVCLVFLIKKSVFNRFFALIADCQKVGRICYIKTLWCHKDS